MEALPDADAPADIQTAVKLFVESLLSQMSGGRNTLITRLIELISVSTLTHNLVCNAIKDSSLQHHPANTCIGKEMNPEGIEPSDEDAQPCHTSARIAESCVGEVSSSGKGGEGSDEDETELLQDDTLEPQPGTRLAVVVDDRGALVDRHALVMAEKTLLCEVGSPTFCWASFLAS